MKKDKNWQRWANDDGILCGIGNRETGMMRSETGALLFWLEEGHFDGMTFLMKGHFFNIPSCRGLRPDSLYNF
jgi:hypothetical protein